jgi:hypothetical protein
VEESLARPEIIERGLCQIEADKQAEAAASNARQRVLEAQGSTGIVSLPRPGAPRRRHKPIAAGERPASELIIAERHAAQ